MAKREKSTDKQARKRKDAEQTENRAKDIGPPKDKSGKVKGGRAYSGSDLRLKRAIRPL